MRSNRKRWQKSTKNAYQKFERPYFEQLRIWMVDDEVKTSWATFPYSNNLNNLKFDKLPLGKIVCVESQERKIDINQWNLYLFLNLLPLFLMVSKTQPYKKNWRS
jgi:hypothetical protein